jgi:hypothetical protein
MGAKNNYMFMQHYPKNDRRIYLIIFVLMNVIMTSATVLSAKEGIQSIADVTEYFYRSCPDRDSKCIKKESNKMWVDPESAIYIIKYLANDDRAFIDEYFISRYTHEDDGNVKVFLLNILAERNRVANLPFIIDRLMDSTRIGREGDRPNILALRYLQKKILVEYDCDDKRMGNDIYYMKRIRNIYNSWYGDAAKIGVEYKKDFQVFETSNDLGKNMESHLKWTIECRAKTYK